MKKKVMLIPPGGCEEKKCADVIKIFFFHLHVTAGDPRPPNQGRRHGHCSLPLASGNCIRAAFGTLATQALVSVNRFQARLESGNVSIVSFNACRYCLSTYIGYACEMRAMRPITNCPHVLACT